MVFVSYIAVTLLDQQQQQEKQEQHKQLHSAHRSSCTPQQEQREQQEQLHSAHRSSCTPQQEQQEQREQPQLVLTPKARPVQRTSTPKARPARLAPTPKGLAKARPKPRPAKASPAPWADGGFVAPDAAAYPDAAAAGLVAADAAAAYPHAPWHQHHLRGTSSDSESWSPPRWVLGRETTRELLLRHRALAVGSFHGGARRGAGD